MYKSVDKDIEEEENDNMNNAYSTLGAFPDLTSDGVYEPVDNSMK